MGGAHHWARQLAQLGHEVRLIPPAYVKPLVKRQKNDAIDAEAIREAAQRPSIKRNVVELLLIDLDVGVGIDLEDLHKVFVEDFFELEVLNPVTGISVDLIETDLLGIGSGRKKVTREMRKKPFRLACGAIGNTTPEPGVKQICAN